MSNCWAKLGRIEVPDVPQSIFDAPVIEADGNHHSVATPTDGSPFWFKRKHSDAIVTMADGPPKKYLASLDLPEFEFRGANFLVMHSTLGWHIDSGRITTLNVAIQNAGLGRVEFEDGSSYVMERGDIYCLDVTKKHRIVLEEDRDKDAGPRILLNIGLHHGFNSEETQKIINDIREYVSAR